MENSLTLVTPGGGEYSPLREHVPEKKDLGERSAYTDQIGVLLTPSPHVGFIIDLLERVSSLEKEVKEMKEMLRQFSFLDNFSSDIIELKDTSYSQAKEEIAEYFRKNDGKEVGYEELIEELKIDPKLVVRACNDLFAEGKIG